MPSPRDATVASTGGSHVASAPASTAFPRPPPSSPVWGGGEWWGATCRNAFPRRIPNITSTSWRSVSAPGRSLLLTTYTSAISITPALSVWMPSPDSGTSTSSVVSALRAISSSVWPTPTVSTRMRANPNASSRSATSSVVVARPPCAPRVAMERMKTCGSRLADSIRMRSPSSAPPVNGLVGSTATTPTESPCPRYCWMSRSVSVLLPAPGGPVMPIRRAAPRASRGCAWLSTRSKPSRWFSTRVIARASAAGSCRSSASRMRSTLMQSNQTRGAPSRPLLRAIERHGPHRARPHRDALHPRGSGREDIEFQSLQREPLPRPGDASQRLEQQAAHRLRAPRLERDPEALLEPARGGVALDRDDAGGGLAGGGRRRARLEDLRHQVPQQILERHEPCRPAEFVEHHGEVTPAALHFQHEIRRTSRAGHDQGGADRHGRVGRDPQQVERMGRSDHLGT